MDRNQVNLRLDRELIAALDELARVEHLERPELARLLLREGVDRHRGDLALRDYSQGRVTASRAAELAGVSLYDMLDRIHEAGVAYELDPAELDAIRRQGDGEPPDPDRSVGSSDRRDASHAQVAESPAPYGASGRSDLSAADPVDAARDRYRPTRVQRLFVRESSPEGGTHFYLANSNLFRAIRAAFAQAAGPVPVPDGEAFLAYFAERGNWLVDLADVPVNHLPGADRGAAVRAGIPGLARTIAAEHPSDVIAVKATVGQQVRAAAAEAKWDGRIDVLPFPVRQWRKEFVDRLAALVGDPPRTTASRSGGRANATSTIVVEEVLTQRVTEKDLARGQIRIPMTGRGKSFFPSTRERVPVTIRGQLVQASYDPHYDPDQQRSGVLRIGKALESIVRSDERLRISRGADGELLLD